MSSGSARPVGEVLRLRNLTMIENIRRAEDPAWRERRERQQWPRRWRCWTSRAADAPVFPSPAKAGSALSEMALTAVLRRLGRGELTVHGLRSTFRDWAGETTAHPREVIEAALAHRLNDEAEAAYARGDLFAKRRRLMEDWAAYLGQVEWKLVTESPSAAEP
jgi:integrase